MSDWPADEQEHEDCDDTRCEVLADPLECPRHLDAAEATWQRAYDHGARA